MLAATLNGNIVTNVIVVDEIPQGYVECPSWVGIGMDINTPNPGPTASENKQTATQLLYETDWTSIADVASQKNKPYLGNQTEFLSYRNQLRAIAVNPTDGFLNWPIKPTEQWIS